MSRVRRSDVMLLEAYMRRTSKGMSAKIRDPYPKMNTPYDNPVLLTWGSNSIECDRDDLEPLIDAMIDVMDGDDDMSANGFLRGVWMPFLREHADKT